MTKHYCDICGGPAVQGGIFYTPVGTLKIGAGIDFLKGSAFEEKADLCPKHRIEMLEIVIEYLEKQDSLSAATGPAGMCD